MNIKIEPDALESIRQSLKEKGKNAVRFDIMGFGWGGPVFEIVLDEQKENDVVTDISGVKFVVEKDISQALGDPEIIKVNGRFTIANNSIFG